MLGYPHDVRNMCLGDEGILKYMKPGSFLIDHTTSSPGLAKEISDAAKLHKIKSLDAPVSGGDIGAKNGCLVTMVGGETADFEEVKTLLSVYSAEV